MCIHNEVSFYDDPLPDNFFQRRVHLQHVQEQCQSNAEVLVKSIKEPSFTLVREVAVAPVERGWRERAVSGESDAKAVEGADAPKGVLDSRTCAADLHVRSVSLLPDVPEPSAHHSLPEHPKLLHQLF